MLLQPTRRVIPLLALLLITLGLTPARVAAQGGGALVTVDAVVMQAFTQTTPTIGRLVAQQAGTAAARIAGTVATMLVRVGDRVTQGQVLAEVDTATLQLQTTLAEARRTEAVARLQAATAQLALASQETTRMSGLAHSSAISQAAHDDAQQRQRIADAQKQEAAAAVKTSTEAVHLAELNLGYAKISAPFDGTVTVRLTEVGSYLQPGQAVVRLISDQRLEMEADVPYDHLGGLAAGTEVVMLLDNGSQHRATTRAIIPEEDPKTRTRRVRFTTDLGDDAGLLAAQQSVTVLIPTSAPRDILSVHKDALIQRGANNLVFVVVDESASIRTIQIGESSGSRVEVLAGLQRGDLAVVRGNERLQPDQKVIISNPTSQ